MNENEEERANELREFDFMRGPSTIKEDINPNTLILLQQILQVGLEKVGDLAEEQALLGKDVDAQQQAEALAKMWGLDWLNKTPEQMEAELEAEEAAAAARGEDLEEESDLDDDEEGEEEDEATFGQRTGFREPPFVFDYGFNPLIALGQFIRSRHPKRRLKHLGNIVRAFRVERSCGIRAVTFAAPGPCSVDATASACNDALAAAADALSAVQAEEADDSAAGTVRTDNGGDAQVERYLAKTEAASRRVRVCEAVAGAAAAALAASNLPGGSDAEVAKVFDPRLGAAGRRHAEALAAELELTFTQPAGPLFTRVGSAEAQRQSLREANGLKLKKPGKNPFGLVVVAPLTACLETAELLLESLPGVSPGVVVDPSLTLTSVLPKGGGGGNGGGGGGRGDQSPEDLRDKRDAQLPCGKGRSAAELKAEFPSSSRSSNNNNNNNDGGGAGESTACEEEPSLSSSSSSSSWDFSALESPKSWRVSSNPVARPGYFHPQRLEGKRSEEALSRLCEHVPKSLLVVAQPAALARLLGVGAHLLAPPAAAAQAHKGKALQHGLVRRQVGSEFAFSTPFLVPKGRGCEVPLATSLVRDLLPLVAPQRGFVGFALHFEHEEGDAPLPGEAADDADLRLAGGAAAYGPSSSSSSSGAGGGGHRSSVSDEYESYGRKYQVRGVLQVTWSNQGFADECNRWADIAVGAVDKLLSDHGCSAPPPNKKQLEGKEEGGELKQAQGEEKNGGGGGGSNDDSGEAEEEEEESGKAAVRSSPYSGNRYLAKLDKWPPCLPGQGASLAKPRSSVAGCVGRAALFVRLQFHSSQHLEQGRKTYRDKIQQGQAAQGGFVQGWVEVDASSSFCRFTSLWGSLAERDAALEVANDLYTNLLAPLSRPGTMQVCRGRTVAPNTLPDANNRGLYDDGSSG